MKVHYGEGVANRCHTCRTQCRESVSQTPERVRKAEASRQTSEVGAVCRKAARTVLCGGRPVMGVPTAIASSAYTGVGVLRSTWAVLTLRRRDPDWNATKRRRDSEPRPAWRLSRSALPARLGMPAESRRNFGS